MSDNEQKTLDLFCPNCNILVQAKVRGTAYGPVTEEVAGLCGPEDSLYGAVRYEVAICGRCSGPFLIETRSTELPGEFIADQESRVLFPSTIPPALVGVPIDILRAYEQASRAYTAGLYDACAIMCRKCLDGLCQELKASGRNLKDRLAYLADSKTIDSRLHEWADQLRIVGNDAAHDVSVILDKNDAKDSIEFVEAILLYTFTLNKKFSAFIERRKPK